MRGFQAYKGEEVCGGVLLRPYVLLRWQVHFITDIIHKRRDALPADMSIAGHSHEVPVLDVPNRHREANSNNSNSPDAPGCACHTDIDTIVSMQKDLIKNSVNETGKASHPEAKPALSHGMDVELNGNNTSEKPGVPAEYKSLGKMGLLTAVAIAIHNFPEVSQELLFAGDTSECANYGQPC